ncbi:MAG: Flagellar hook-associated protein 1 [Thermocaproicibacter melissae]
MSSMFEGLYIARSGVQASKAALNITGQNITNANTEGYTRQRVDQNSLPPSDSGGQWASLGTSVGTGVSVDSISQLRDAFLDSEYRTQNAKSGESAQWVDTLYDMEDIFTTTTTASSSSNVSVIDVLSNQFSNFLTQLQNITSSYSSVSEGNVREAAKSLATQLNTAARALNTIREQQYNHLEEYNVNTVNDLLKSIASLDKRIKDAELSGSPVLELKDQQNLLLDKLSKYVPIKVVQESEKLDNGKSVDTTKVYLADANGNKLAGNYELIGGADGSDYAQFTITQDAPEEGKSFGITQLHLTKLSVNGTIPTDADGNPELQGMTNDDIATGAFAASLALLNDSGDYDGDSTSPRGIGFYSQYLDTIARELASTLNNLNYNPNKKDSSGNTIPAEQQILFSGSVETGTLDDITKGITAANIHVASTWKDGVLTTNKDVSNSGDDNSGACPNILTMIAKLKDDKITLTTDTGAIVFNGTLQKAFASVSAMLALNTNSMQTIDNTNSQLLNNIDNSRQELSSVSLDDEAISIVQYTQSLNASSRFMTAVDECLQTIINNMGLVGRG